MKKITLSKALKKEDKFHIDYPFAPKDCKHESLEWVGNGAGCYNCGIGFWSEPWKDYGDASLTVEG